MSRKRFGMDLAKLVIAAAWADGEVQHEELNTLKHWLLGIPGVGSEEWRELRIYLDHPVTEDERDQLLENVVTGIRSKHDKALVVETLRSLVEADGVVTPEEAELMTQVEQAVEARGTGLIGAVSGLLRGARGPQTVREHRIDDFVHNPVYFRVSHRAEQAGETLPSPEASLREACLAAGMMAVVAWADGHLAAAEERVMAALLADSWGLEPHEVTAVSRAAIDMAGDRIDVYRLGESLKQTAEMDSRRAVLGALVSVAAAFEGVSEEELDKLRRLTRSLGLAPRDLARARRGAGAGREA